MDERVEQFRISVKTAQNKTVCLRGFRARDFRSVCQQRHVSVYPRPPLSDPIWWGRFYRLQINRRWYNPSGSKYHFFTNNEILDLVNKLIDGCKL